MVGVRHVVTTCCVLACAGAVACTGGGGGGTTSDVQGFVAQYCDIFAPCCGKLNRPTDGSQCRNLYGEVANGKQYDAAKGQACLDTYRAEAAKATFCDDGPSSDTSSACDGVFTGPAGGAKPGEPCKDDTDCAPSPEGKVDCRSEYQNGAETRLCQVQIKGKEGDTPCVGTRDGNTTSYSYVSTSGQAPPPPPSRGYICNVADGIYCNSQENKCVKIADVGGACQGSTSHACVKTAYCDSSKKTCAARVAVGSDCGNGTVSSNACVEKSYCDSTTKKCVATLAEGSPCERSDQCESRSCVNKRCDKSGSGFAELGYLLLCGPASGGG